MMRRAHHSFTPLPELPPITLHRIAHRPAVRIASSSSARLDGQPDIDNIDDPVRLRLRQAMRCPVAAADIA